MNNMKHYEIAAQKQKEEYFAAEFIRTRLDSSEMIAQLAEEAVELAHAALKLRRAVGLSNPTPVTPEDAYAAVLEELADVTLLVRLLYLNTDTDEVEAVCRHKLLRWRDRLLKASEETEK